MHEKDRNSLATIQCKHGEKQKKKMRSQNKVICLHQNSIESTIPVNTIQNTFFLLKFVSLSFFSSCYAVKINIVSYRFQE